MRICDRCNREVTPYEQFTHDCNSARNFAKTWVLPTGVTLAEADYQYPSHITAEVATDFALSECSRLASRVEELEAVIKNTGACRDCKLALAFHFRDGMLISCEDAAALAQPSGNTPGKEK